MGGAANTYQKILKSSPPILGPRPGMAEGSLGWLHISRSRDREASQASKSVPEPDISLLPPESHACCLLKGQRQKKGNLLLRAHDCPQGPICAEQVHLLRLRGLAMTTAGVMPPFARTNSLSQVFPDQRRAFPLLKIARTESCLVPPFLHLPRWAKTLIEAPTLHPRACGSRSESGASENIRAQTFGMLSVWWAPCI